MGDVMCAALQEDYSHILEYYCTKPVAVALMHLNQRAIHASARYSQIIPVRPLLLMRSDDKSNFL